MIGAAPSIWARRILTMTAAILLLIVGAATALADLQPGPTVLTLQTQTSAEFVVEASGSLTDSGGEPIAGAPLQASLNGETVSDGATDYDGSYALTFTLPETSRSGEQQLTVVFAGYEGFDSSQAATTIAVGTPPAPPPAPSTPPEDARLDVFLKVSIAPAIVSAGDLVTIEGTLTDQNNAPIDGARLSVMIGDTESKDSLVVTSAEGTFQTFAEMPPDTPSGTTELVVNFAGNGSYTPGLKRFDVTVDDLPLATAPTTTDTPSATAEPSATADASGSPTADTPATTPSTDTTDNTDPLSWFYVALIVVGGLAILIAAALVFRGMYGHKPPTRLEDQDLDSLLQPDDASEAEEGALLSDTFLEVDTDSGDVGIDDVEPEGPPPPRRGLD